MRQITFRVLILLAMVGLLIFAPTQESRVNADSACVQSCYAQYQWCLNGGGGDFFGCCAAYNDCLQENCATSPKCHLPIEYP
jgi:uncharacterized protein YgiB involved in biofilm formation